MTDELRIDYLPLSELKRHPRNPKDHDLGAISRSVNRFGFTAPVILDERTGYLAAGHGRIDTLAQLKAQGKQPPANVKTDKAGEWLVPVVRGHGFNSDEEVEAYLVADNRITSLGGWNEPELVALLQDLAQSDNELLETTGYDGDDLQALIDALAPATEGEWSLALGNLPDGDRAPFQQMTFTLHDEQVEQVRAAIEAAKGLGSFVDSPNENSNGNALARICETFLTYGQR